ncbi:FecR family protein [Pseudoflavitalea rhizosphaerae]|uniref:FecR family protein n=1 Tax=Pseudoflavitalea rhizosphaerae TaxID=1884793 RepID=UPI000F8DD6F9|nr:FecR family protein [Pseudoflavitalea rhizosphaerae]
MAIARIDILIERFSNGSIGEEEHAELLHLLSMDEHAAIARKFFKEVMDQQPANAAFFNESESNLLFESVQQKMQEQDHKPVLRRLPWLKWTAAAAAACLLAIAGYQYFNKTGKADTADKLASQETAKPDFLPGKKNKAVLILADNSQIVLDSTNAGILGKQGSSMIRKAENGEIIYETGMDPNQSSGPVYNILEIPVGGEYSLVLSDGSKVWLNAASRLKFPVKFTGDSREVEVSGEAYFEIARNKSKPFRVRFNNSTVEVLGTHFNVSAYENDHVQAVTLLEGSVKVLNPLSEVLIKPGEQARLSTSSTISVKQVDAEEAVAWKNGYFSFADEDIKSIMKKLARWYGFSAEYHGNVDSERFGGMISRFKNISEVLSMFERTGTIQFKLIQGDASGKGRKIIITK